MIEEAFDGKVPRTAHYLMPVEEFVSICAPLNPAFIHHPTTLELIRNVVGDLDCGLEDSYIDRATSKDGHARRISKPPVSATRTILIAIPGTPPQCASSIGGFRSTPLTRKARWLFMLATGPIDQKRIEQLQLSRAEGRRRSVFAAGMRFDEL